MFPVRQELNVWVSRGCICSCIRGHWLCGCVWTGPAVVPDLQSQPWADDGWPQWLWQNSCLEGSSESPWTLRGDRGRGPRHWSQGHFQRGLVWGSGSKHTGMDRWPLYTHLEVQDCNTVHSGSSSEVEVELGSSSNFLAHCLLRYISII